MSKFYTALCLFAAVASLWYAGSVHAAPAGSTVIGTNFILGAVNSPNGQRSNITIIINTQVSTNATISSDFGVIDVPAFARTAIIVLPGDLIPNNVQGVSNLGIRVETEEPSSVQMIVNTTEIENGSEGTLVYPVGTLGTRYITNGVRSNGAFTIVSPANSVNVNVTFSNGTRVNFTIDALDSISFSGPNSDGAIIQADSPVAVFLGRDCSKSSPPECGDPVRCSYLLEQAVRVENFDRNYVLVNPANLSRTNNVSTFIRLVSGEDSDVIVEVSGTTFTADTPLILRPQDEVAVEIRNLTTKITANGRIDVQVIAGSPFLGNRSQFGLIPNSQFVSRAFFFNEPNTNDTLALVALTSDVRNSSNTLRFNDEEFALDRFKPSANPDYSYVIFTPTRGADRMEASFNLAGYLFESRQNVTDFGSIIGRNL